MEIEDLIKILEGDLSLIPTTLIGSSVAAENQVPIYPYYVKASLERYLSSEWSAQELRTWADFLNFYWEYSSPHADDEDYETYWESYYEAMWDVIFWVAAPYINGEITIERIKEYMTHLKKYDNDPPPRDLLTIK